MTVGGVACSLSGFIFLKDTLREKDQIDVLALRRLTGAQ
jgi:hypothetical protein